MDKANKHDIRAGVQDRRDPWSSVGAEAKQNHIFIFYTSAVCAVQLSNPGAGLASVEVWLVGWMVENGEHTDTHTG